jgi:hypothetical protein
LYIHGGGAAHHGCTHRVHPNMISIKRRARSCTRQKGEATAAFCESRALSLCSHGHRAALVLVPSSKKLFPVDWCGHTSVLVPSCMLLDVTLLFICAEYEFSSKDSITTSVIISDLHCSLQMHALESRSRKLCSFSFRLAVLGADFEYVVDACLLSFTYLTACYFFLK